MSGQDFQSMEPWLEQLGYSLDELSRIDEELKGMTRNPWVCACGHAASSHTEVGDAHMCKPSRLFCHCEVLNPVLEVEDTRVFKFKTNNYGPEHALTRGLLAHTKRQKKARWLKAGYRCFYRGCEVSGFDSKLIPALIEYPTGNWDSGRMVWHYKNSMPSPWQRKLQDGLYCVRHLDKYRLMIQ